MVVELKDVTKVFPGVKALDRVSFDIRSGEIVGLVGENGAGKSTLMKILSGVYPYGTYEGEISIDGRSVQIKDPKTAEGFGIAIIHQELSTFPHMSVMENIFVGTWPVAAGTVDWEAMRAETQSWLDRVGARCRPEQAMGEISLGQQQLVEIAKALRKNSRVLIFDEPTSSLTPQETANLTALIQDLKKRNHAVVYISHRMEEIFALCDRVLVLRDGQSVYKSETAKTNLGELVEHMVGRKVENIYPEPPPRDFGDVLVELKDFTTVVNESLTLGPLNIELRAGEIVGFGGLLGAGRSELMRAIYGIPREGLKKGLSFVSEDRKGESILPSRSLSENESISWLSCFSNRFTVDLDSEQRRSEARLGQLGTRYARLSQTITDLSGGNQQKVIIGRALETDAPVLILDEPTRGIDVMAKSEIYEIIFRLAKAGKGILLVSSDLPELMALSDRIYMMRDGKISGSMKRGEYTQAGLMRLAFGAGEKR